MLQSDKEICYGVGGVSLIWSGLDRMTGGNRVGTWLAVGRRRNLLSLLSVLIGNRKVGHDDGGILGGA